MKILYARFNDKLAKLDIGLGEYANAEEFQSFLASTPYDPKNVNNIDEILYMGTDIVHGKAFIVKEPGQLKGCHEKLKTFFRSFKSVDKMSAADQELLEDFDRFIKTAEVRATSLDKKELYDHGAFTLVDNGHYPFPLFINNWYVGEFDTKLELEGPSETMDEEGNHLDSETGGPIEPLKEEGEKMGDELLFVATSACCPYYLNDLECGVFTPDQALRDFVDNNPPQHEHQIELAEGYKPVKAPWAGKTVESKER